MDIDNATLIMGVNRHRQYHFDDEIVGGVVAPAAKHG
jgi:hypothetical protein